MDTNGNVGMSGHNFDAFVGSQRTFNDYDLAAKIQEKYWRARQKFLAKIERNEDACIVLSDSKLDAKLEIYKSIDQSCAKLINILDSYQNCLYVFANEENSLGILLKECSKLDKTKAGKIMSITGKSLTQSSHQRIRLYMPLMRMYQEMETFHSRAVEDTAGTVSKLEEKRSQYRASLLWMKDISEKLNPDVFKQLDKFRRIQNHVRSDKRAFDDIQMDVVQKIDLLMASRCNLMNQILASYQQTLLETIEKNFNIFKSVESMIKKEDIYEYEFKTLKQLNPLQISENSSPVLCAKEAIRVGDPDDNNNEGRDDVKEFLIDIAASDGENNNHNNQIVDDTKVEPYDVIDQLESLFGNLSESEQPKQGASSGDDESKKVSSYKPNKENLKADLLNMDCDEQIANLLGLSEAESRLDPFASIDLNRDILSHATTEKSNVDVISEFSSDHSEHVKESTTKDSYSLDLIGDTNSTTPSQRPELSSSNLMELLTNELDDIDNSSYFKSLQRLQL